MSEFSLVGIAPKTKLVDVVASIDSRFTDDHIRDMMAHGLLVVVTTKEKAREKGGTVIDSVYDFMES